MSTFWTSFLANFSSNIAAVAFLSVVGYEFRGMISSFVKRIINPQSLELAFPEGEKREIRPDKNKNYDLALNLNIFYFSRSPFNGKKVLHVYLPREAKHIGGDLQLVDSSENYDHYKRRLDDEILPGQSQLHQPYDVFRFEKYKGDKRKFDIYYFVHSSQGYFPDRLNEYLVSKKPIDPSKGGTLEINLLD